MEQLEALSILSLLLGVYFLPYIVAACRHCQHLNGIVVLNFLLGWTVFGWVMALVWAVSDDVFPTRRRIV